LTQIGMLGYGVLGCVSLVRSPDGGIYAQKKLSKAKILDSENEENVAREKKIMSLLDSWTVMGLERTYKDAQYVYFLMRPCLGGELFARIKEVGEFDNSTAQFYGSCVVLGLGHLNALGVIYRDLKPENILIDEKGFAKLIDFGAAKRIGRGGKTNTLVGTPDYTAPEIIRGEGHSFEVDWWSLGVVIFEMLTGKPPFQKGDPGETFGIILQQGQKYIQWEEVIKAHSLSKVVVDLIKRLLLYKPEKRLGGPEAGGMASVQKHVWFKSVDWDKLERRRVVPPLQVQLDSAEDLKYFRMLPFDQATSCTWEEVEDPDFDYARVAAWDPDF